MLTAKENLWVNFMKTRHLMERVLHMFIYYYKTIVPTMFTVVQHQGYRCSIPDSVIP